MLGTQTPTTPSVRWFHDGLTPLYLCVCVPVPVRVQCASVPVDACRCGWRGTTWRSAGGRVTEVRFPLDGGVAPRCVASRAADAVRAGPFLPLRATRRLSA